MRKWNDFKECDLFRKFSLCLNDVPLTHQQLCGASCEQLEGLSGNFDQTTDASEPNFVINVPDIPKEFPGQSHKKTTIYPLPISQENQCKTLGMARNLDIFGEEFGFIKKENNSSLRLLKSGEDFDLDLAYTRYAFLKSMEKHKERQKILETKMVVAWRNRLVVEMMFYSFVRKVTVIAHQILTIDCLVYTVLPKRQCYTIQCL